MNKGSIERRKKKGREDGSKTRMCEEGRKTSKVTSQEKRG